MSAKISTVLAFLTLLMGCSANNQSYLATEPKALPTEEDNIDLSEDYLRKLFNPLGKWEGVAKAIYDPNGNNSPWPDGAKYRIDIGCEEIKVYFEKDSKWLRVKEEPMYWRNSGIGMIISSLDDGGGWVEKWSIQLTRFGHSEMDMWFLRSVQNVLIKLDNPWHSYAILLYGRL